MCAILYIYRFKSINAPRHTPVWINWTYNYFARTGIHHDRQSNRCYCDRSRYGNLARCRQLKKTFYIPKICFKCTNNDYVYLYILYLLRVRHFRNRILSYVVSFSYNLAEDSRLFSSHGPSWGIWIGHYRFLGDRSHSNCLHGTLKSGINWIHRYMYNVYYSNFTLYIFVYMYIVTV